MVRAGENPVYVAWPHGEKSCEEVKKILDKWPADLQKQFMEILGVFQNSLANSYEKHRELKEAPVSGNGLKPTDVFSGQEIWQLALTLRKLGIIPNLKYIREDMEYLKLSFQIVNLLAGYSQPEGHKVPLVNIFGFMHSGENNDDGKLAENALEAYFMAYWERNMGKFQFDFGGQKVWELSDRDNKRNAIITLTKKFSQEIKKSFHLN